MNDKDLILQQLISNPNRNPDTYFTPESLRSVILKEKNRDEVEFLIKEIIKERPELIKIEKKIGQPFAFSPSSLIKSFLENGGFKKLETDSKEKKDLEFRKLQIDLELAEKTLEEFPRTKWFARIAFVIAIVLALKELYIWLMQSQ